jgi:hypothetical protein
MLLPEEAHPIDHLLGARAGGLQTTGETRVLALQELYSLRRDDSFHSGDLETLESSLGLERATSKGGELVTEVLDQQLQLGERRDLRSYAV